MWIQALLARFWDQGRYKPPEFKALPAPKSLPNVSAATYFGPDNQLMLGIWLTHRLGSMATMEWVKSPKLILMGRVYLLEYTLVCVKQVPLITISGRNEKAYRWSPTKIGVATFRRKGTLPWTWYGVH